MSGKTLTDEAMCFFGELQTKRPNTVKSKLAEFLKKEDQLRKCVLFKIMRERGGRNPEEDRRHPTSNLKISPSAVSSMRRIFLSNVTSVEQL